MKIETTRFGETDVAEEKVVTIKSGIIGFEGLERFVVLDHEGDSPFKWLQSLEDSSLAFVVLDPSVASIDFNFKIPDEIVEDLRIEKGDDVVVMVIVTIPEDPREMTVNLRAPLIINSRNLRGRQLILSDDGIPIRYPIVERNEESGAEYAARCSGAPLL